MCLIVAKKAGVEFNFEALCNGFKNNPDGAGFMYPTTRGVQIERGFGVAAGLIDVLDSAPDLVGLPVVVHFRWATHGKVDVRNCHPFPVCKRITQDTSLLTEVGIAHNGIIPGMRPKSVKSDTVQYIEKHLYKVKDRLFDKRVCKKILKETRSKFVVMRKDGKINLLGDFIEKDGIYYSNATYESYLPYSTGWTTTEADSCFCEHAVNWHDPVEENCMYKDCPCPQFDSWKEYMRTEVNLSREYEYD